MGSEPIDQLVSWQLVEAIKGPIKLLKTLWIRGIEVTQGVQHYRSADHLTDTADQGPDNSVRIVAHKPLWVRVYVRSLFASAAGVSGTLRVYRRSLGPIANLGATLTPQPPGTMTAQTSIDYDDERGDLANTLNFVIPADLVCGKLRLEVDVSHGSRTDTSTLDLNVTLRQTLRMRIIPVTYDGTDDAGDPLALPAPALATAIATAGWSLLVYPVRSTPNISLSAAVELTFPLTGSPANPGGCAQSWIDLNQLIAQAKTADGNQPNTFYYGLVPDGVPLGANSGCASSGVTSGIASGQMTMAHEFGHALGYPHAPCGGVGSGDPNFPAYEPYDAADVPGGTLGEYGLDISNGAIKSPATHRDYMSYCGPRWISLFNYERALNHSKLNPQTTCLDLPWKFWDEILVDPWWWLRHPLPEPVPPPWLDEVVKPFDPRERVISLIGVHHLDGRVEVRSITRTLAAPELEGARRTDLLAELVGEGGESLAVGAVMRLASQGACGCGNRGHAGTDDDARGPYLFQVMLADVGRGAALRLKLGDRELWRADAPRTTPKVAEFTARLTKGGLLDLSWSVTKSDRPLETWVRWRTSPRQEPQVLCVGRNSGSRKVSIESIPAGPVLVDVVVHDGFSTVVSRAVRVRIPARPPTLAIVHPQDRRTLGAGSTLRLHAVATTPGHEQIDEKACVWRIDGKEVARGFDVFIAAPPAGKHDVTVAVLGKGGEAKAQARITTLDPHRAS